MNRLLDLDADTRISVEDAINHPFFNTVRAEHLAASEENTIRWVSTNLKQTIFDDIFIENI